MTATSPVATAPPRVYPSARARLAAAGDGRAVPDERPALTVHERLDKHGCQNLPRLARYLEELDHRELAGCWYPLVVEMAERQTREAGNVEGLGTCLQVVRRRLRVGEVPAVVKAPTLAMERLRARLHLLLPLPGDGVQAAAVVTAATRRGGKYLYLRKWVRTWPEFRLEKRRSEKGGPLRLWIVRTALSPTIPQDPPPC